MKLKFNQLELHLANKALSPIYILSGDEPLQLLESKQMIIAKARSCGFDDINILQADKEFKWEDFISAAYNVSLFATKSIIDLQIKNFTPQAKKILQQYKPQSAVQNIVILSCNKLTSADYKAAWFKSLEPQAVHIDIWPIESNQLPSWIKQRFAADDFNISDELAYLIADKVEGNLVAAAQEIDKLKILSEHKTITTELVEQAITNCAKFDAYKLADKTIEGDIKVALKILFSLKATDGEPPIILWALARELRILNHFARLKAQNINENQIFQQIAKICSMPVFFINKKASTLNMAMQRHSEASIRDMIILVASIDQAIKGVIKEDPWELLIVLVKKICSYTCGKTV
jgi:DNA polymerase-3 subunit delta